MNGAIAVDFGATSGRFAAGTLRDGRIHFEVIRQIPHEPHFENGRLVWNLDVLLGLCREAINYAGQHYDQATVGIDSWGVDHGFIDRDGKLLAAPVCYRDLSHLDAFERLKPHRERLYALTGCQHQPFNTICQLEARSHEDPSLPGRADWLILPDLIAFLLTGERGYELTQASTSQLLGLDNRWSPEAFELAGWRTPGSEPFLPGRVGKSLAPNVQLAHVGSHDTASAVCGFGELDEQEAFLNVGTWTLFGTVVPTPIVSSEAELAAFTNERTVDGKVRFLKNIPGFYVINRMHEELAIRMSVPNWLANLAPVEERVDLLDQELFNPESMVETCARLAGRTPKSDAEWAGLALSSLTHTISSALPDLERLTGKKIRRLRVGGGGSKSVHFCKSLAEESGLTVCAGPVEATVLGNLAMQMLASGTLTNMDQVRNVVQSSADVQTYE